VVLDPNLKPNQNTIAPINRDGAVRSVAAIADNGGNKTDFVENEILLFTNDSVTAQKLASRWKGQVVATVDFAKGRLKKVPSMYLIHIRSSLANTLTLSKDLGAANKLRTGTLRVSSKDGLLTLAIAAWESANGLQVGLNFVLTSNLIHDRNTTEGTGPFTGPDNLSYDNDAFHWPYIMLGGNQDIGVGEAWRALEVSGRFKNKVDVLIVDSGFDPNPDFPSNSVTPSGTAGMPGPGNCGSAGACPFHGTDVALAGFAIADNGFGAAGPGWSVANLMLVSTPSLDVFQILRFLESLISGLVTGPRIIKKSATARITPVVCHRVCGPHDLIGSGFRALNILTFASAGNEGQDVDRRDCIGFTCWESGEDIPCEIFAVICVGGLDWNSKSRHRRSNFGSDSRDPSDLTTVRMFAPFEVWDLNIHNLPNVGIVSGTSISAPFAAGVAALVMAANPTLSADEVDGILMRTAHSSPDPTVPRYVNAFEAVKAGLGGSVPPTLTLVSPLTGLQAPQDHIIEFQARAVNTDLQNISSNIVWTSNIPSDNPLPSGSYWVANDGAHPQFSLLPGVHNITASVTDHGWTDSSMVSITVTAVPLTVEIASPSGRSNHFFPADNVILIGHSRYLQGLSLPDGNVSWSDSTTGTPLGTGHGPLFVRAGTLCPNPPCHQTLLFAGSVAGPPLATASASVDIFIDPTPTGPPPQVTIDSPGNNASFTGDFLGCVPLGQPQFPVFSAIVNLRGHAIDRNGAAIPDSSLTWHLNWVGGPVIGTGSAINASIVETAFHPGQPIGVQIFLVALDDQRNSGSMSITTDIATRPVRCS
jgi:hypothetical protein